MPSAGKGETPSPRLWDTRTRCECRGVARNTQYERRMHGPQVGLTGRMPVLRVGVTGKMPVVLTGGTPVVRTRQAV